MTLSDARHRPTAVVTGATAGIGFFTAKALARRGWAVTVTGRDEGRGRRAVSQLRERGRHDAVRFVPVDHSTVADNARLSGVIEQGIGSLDLLINNAGGIYSQRWESADGYEGTLAMNFVGPVAWTLGLLPALRRGQGRCLNVVSSAFKMAKGDPFADLASERGYVGIQTYGRAKLLNVLWIRALAGREPDIVANAVNPGTAWTLSTQALTPAAVPAWRFVWPLVRWFQRRASAEDAAAVPLRVATREIDAPSGTYINDKGRHGRLPDLASDPAALARVWSVGEHLVAQATQTSEHHQPSTAQDWSSK